MKVEAKVARRVPDVPLQSETPKLAPVAPVATGATEAATGAAAGAAGAEQAKAVDKPIEHHVFDKLTEWAAKTFGHQDPLHPHGPNIITHERPVISQSVFLGVVEVGFTFSELNQIRDHKGLEVVQVVNPDGTGNIELLLRRFQPKWMHGHRFGLQGPAINTDSTGLSGRFLGFELTSDLQTKHSKDALSYTLEVKLTDKSAAVLASLFAPGIAHEIGQLLASHTSSTVAKAIGNVFMAAVPLVSAGIALVSCRRAWKVCKNKESTKEQKAFAIGHAVADLVRVVLPMPGTLMNVGLVLAQAVRAGQKLHHLRAELAAKGESG